MDMMHAQSKLFANGAQGAGKLFLFCLNRIDMNQYALLWVTELAQFFPPDWQFGGHVLN